MVTGTFKFKGFVTGTFKFKGFTKSNKFFISKMNKERGAILCTLPKILNYTSEQTNEQGKT